jgi:hypothetical protein
MTAMLKPSGSTRASAHRPAITRSGQLAPFATPARSPWEPQRIAQFPSRAPLAPQTAAVRTLPKPAPTSIWMKRLVSLQRGSTALSFVLVSAVLGVYSWTVYSQHVWSQEYQRLEQLQENERKLITSNEMLKSEMAQQAEQPGAGLIPPTLDQSIFLDPAPPRPPALAVQPAPSAPVSRQPVGY